MTRSKKTRFVAATLLALAGIAGTAPAWAIIGRPLTPMSYAGVARRTVRRTAYVGAAYAGAAYAGAAYAAPVVAAPPPACPMVNGVYQCGGSTYQPAIQSGTVVYVEH